jgi:hypothetical protein
MRIWIPSDPELLADQIDISGTMRIWFQNRV